MENLKELEGAVWQYYGAHGRHGLPWRKDTSPYSVVVSEVMLQQTQVNRVLTKYAEFMTALPDWQALASATQAEVIGLWQGLGYNRRALWLKKIAEQVVGEYDGELPRDPAELRKLPGIGPNTAGSIAAFAFNAPVVFIETNIRRVFIHHCFADSEGVSDKELSPLLERALEDNRGKAREWYWALMDYGSFLATQQIPNPNRRSKHYAKQSKFSGSDRQIRGEILRLLLAEGMSASQLTDALAPYTQDAERIARIVQALTHEGFIALQKDHYKLA